MSNKYYHVRFLMRKTLAYETRDYTILMPLIYAHVVLLAPHKSNKQYVAEGSLRTQYPNDLYVKIEYHNCKNPYESRLLQRVAERYTKDDCYICFTDYYSLHMVGRVSNLCFGDTLHLSNKIAEQVEATMAKLHILITDIVMCNSLQYKTAEYEIYIK